MSRLQVVSWNVRSLRDDRDAVVSTLRELAPDVALIQEAPRFFRWRSKCAELARRCGMVVVTGGRTAGDCLVLVSLRVRVIEAQAVLLTHQRRLHRRGLAFARVEVAGSSVVVASAHLGLDAEQRVRHAGEIVSLLEPGRLPVVLGADVNETPDGLAWRRLADQWAPADAPGATFPSKAPRRCIDAVFTDLPVLAAAVHVGVSTAAATDHLPVVATLALA